MNPLLAAALGSILRFFLASIFGYLVSRGIWSETEAEIYIVAAVSALLSLGWSLYQKYVARQRLMTALASPSPTSERTVKEMVKRGMSPPVALSEERVPYLEGEAKPFGAYETELVAGTADGSAGYPPIPNPLPSPPKPQPPSPVDDSIRHP